MSFQIDTQTGLFGVIGNPVGHSLSPVMHNAAFESAGYPGVYLAFEVKEVGSAMAGMRGLNIKGMSVTIPHKIEVMKYLDEIDPTAEKIGAVNTVINREGRLLGTNTDCHGAITALESKTGLAGKRVGLLGAGGAARAIGFGLMDRKAMVTVFNRNSQRGQGLAKDLDAEFIPLADFDGRTLDILINTTSLGMYPDIEKMPVEQNCLNGSLVVMDIVYHPLETALLKAARNKGCTIADGVAMFVFQGARQFELWTGRQAPLEVMRKAVLKHLKLKTA
ncbi:MAG: shikimate dehydrogenase [Desulfobacteraceae bacterium]|nr:shikimate dehydrogenase [Desulfobacteraceae bacterium]